MNSADHGTMGARLWLHEDRVTTHAYAATREAAMAAFAKSWRGRSNGREKQMTRDERSKSALGPCEAPWPKGENWKQGRQKDLAADIVVVALEALGLWKETSPT